MKRILALWLVLLTLAGCATFNVPASRDLSGVMSGPSNAPPPRLGTYSVPAYAGDFLVSPSAASASVVNLDTSASTGTLSIFTNKSGATLNLSGDVATGGLTLGVSAGSPYATLDDDLSTFSHAANRRVSSVVDHLSTVDATPTVFTTAQYGLPDLTVADVVVTVIGRSGSGIFAQDYRARYYRNGGATTLVGSVISGSNPAATAPIAAATATLVLASNTIEVQVTGVAATTIAWSCAMQVQQVQ